MFLTFSDKPCETAYCPELCVSFYDNATDRMESKCLCKMDDNNIIFDAQCKKSEPFSYWSVVFRIDCYVIGILNLEWKMVISSNDFFEHNAKVCVQLFYFLPSGRCNRDFCSGNGDCTEVDGKYKCRLDMIIFRDIRQLCF